MWQFNRDHFQLEQRKSGAFKVLGYKNLEQLRQRLRPVLLRRRREEVLLDLPERIDNDFFVETSQDQLGPYGDYANIAAQLVQKAELRPLTPEEQKKLFMALQKMRILADALELHDPRIPAKVRERSAPKLKELQTILEEQVVQCGRKAVVFSSFEGMIDLARASLVRARERFRLGSILQSNGFVADAFTPLVHAMDAALEAMGHAAGLAPQPPALLQARLAEAGRLGQDVAARLSQARELHGLCGASPSLAPRHLPTVEASARALLEEAERRLTSDALGAP